MAFNLNPYYISPEVKIFYSEDIVNDTFLSSLDESSYIFLQFTWNTESTIDACPWDMEENINKMNSRFDFKKQFIFCAPDENIHKKITGNGYTSILLNHNCLLDYNVHTLTNHSKDRKYSAVVNSRPFWWKRVFLAENVDKLAYICGKDWAENESSWEEYKQWDHADIYHEINSKKVNSIYNDSMCGLILSGNTGPHTQNLNEGANYSSAEYLLSGLPVITTPNQGGRNYWFNEHNSIEVPPDPKLISDAVELVIDRLHNKKIIRKQIRREFISASKQMRNNFIDKTQNIFDQHNVDVDACDYFTKKYKHKLTMYDNCSDNDIKNHFEG